MEKPSCSSCPYWEGSVFLVGGKSIAMPRNAQCRRHAPKPDKVASGLMKEVNITSMWPTTGPGDWCGEHPDFVVYLESIKRKDRL